MSGKNIFLLIFLLAFSCLSISCHRELTEQEDEMATGCTRFLQQMEGSGDLEPEDVHDVLEGVRHYERQRRLRERDQGGEGGRDEEDEYPEEPAGGDSDEPMSPEPQEPAEEPMLGEQQEPDEEPAYEEPVDTESPTESDTEDEEVTIKDLRERHPDPMHEKTSAQKERLGMGRRVD